MVALGSRSIALRLLFRVQKCSFLDSNNETDHEYVISRLVHAMRRKKSKLFSTDNGSRERKGGDEGLPRRQTIDENKEKPKKSRKLLSIQSGFFAHSNGKISFPLAIDHWIL